MQIETEILLPKEASWVLVHGETKEHIPFTYTVGLMNSNRVELVIAGLSEKEAALHLNIMAFHVQTLPSYLRDMEGIYLGTQGGGVPDYDSDKIVARELEPRYARQRIFVRAAEHEVNSGIKSRYFQVFYPDLKGLHPWDLGCASEIIKKQNINLPLGATKYPPR